MLVTARETDLLFEAPAMNACEIWSAQENTQVKRFEYRPIITLKRLIHVMAPYA
jgi:hypothetical protein